MQVRTVWQLGSDDPKNAESFATIHQWWSDLANKEITWRQRLIPATGDLSDLNWENQRFDEVFLLKTPQIRGITLYWRKPNAPDERSTTPHKLELDHLQQRLYVYPQSQQEVVIQVGIPEVAYQTLLMQNPQMDYTTTGRNQVLTLRDEAQQLEVKVTLSAEMVDRLQRLLQGAESP